MWSNVIMSDATITLLCRVLASIHSVGNDIVERNGSVHDSDGIQANTITIWWAGVTVFCGGEQAPCEFGGYQNECYRDSLITRI